MDLGFKMAGFEILGATDIWSESKKTFESNFPDIPFLLGDITSVSSKDILKITNGIRPDILIGGPPCQGLSVMGDKNSADPRNRLFENYVRLVKDLQPKCFVFENVKGLKTMFQGRFLTLMAQSFSDLGYDIYFKILNAKEYGVPQSRERVIIVGTKIFSPYLYPIPSNRSIGKLRSFKNVGQAIMDLVDKGTEIANHIPLRHGEIVIERYKLIPEGGKLPSPCDLPKKLRRKNFGNTYIRLRRDVISTTMVPGNNAFPIHPTLNRSLTPREAARIQTFPDSFIFKGSRQQQCILVGNAVPCLMAAHIALSVKYHLNGKNSGKSVTDLLVERGKKIEDPSSSNKKNKKNLMKFVDLFSGAGGISIGLMNAGFQPIFSADFNPAVAKTHRKNFPNIPFIEGDLSSNETINIVKNKYASEEIDLLVGGPPCQGYSSMQRKNASRKDYAPIQDPRNRLVFTYLQYVRTLKPKWFIMENVKGITQLDNGSFVKRLMKDIKMMGYHAEYRIINTADLGVPQLRERFILIANNTGHIIPWPKPKFFAQHQRNNKIYRTVGTVLGGLDNERSYESFKNHKPMAHAAVVKDRFSYIKEGKSLDPKDLPKRLKFSKTGRLIRSFSKVFYRLDRNRPSYTLVPGHSAFPIHPWLNRQITIREAARIQTFPDYIEFCGTQGEQCKQVGNAFPPLAAEYIGNLIIKTIENDWKKDNISTLAKYSIINSSHSPQ